MNLDELQKLTAENPRITIRIKEGRVYMESGQQIPIVITGLPRVDKYRGEHL